MQHNSVYHGLKGPSNAQTPCPALRLWPSRISALRNGGHPPGQGPGGDTRWTDSAGGHHPRRNPTAAPPAGRCRNRCPPEPGGPPDQLLIDLRPRNRAALEDGDDIPHRHDYLAAQMHVHAVSSLSHSMVEAPALPLFSPLPSRLAHHRPPRDVAELRILDLRHGLLDRTTLSLANVVRR